MENTPIEPFVRNAWYIAAWAEELDDEEREGPIARTIMNEPVAIFRGPDGKPAVLEDRCCHRGAPLSHGRMIETGVECGYHGLVFDGTGACVCVPGQDKIPSTARVRAYPTVEKQDIVWVWMGDAEKADESQILDYPWHDQPDKWPRKLGMFQIKANYMMMIDNLMDLTHLAYVHRKTIGGAPQAHAQAELTAEPTPTGCRLVRWMMESPAPPTYIKAVGFNSPIDRWHDFEFVAPASVIQWNGAIASGKGARENQDQDGLQLRLLHHATPETENSFHYFFSVSNGYRQDDPAACEQLYAETYPTFLEDKVIMEAQQDRVEREPERDLVNIKVDAALYLARKALHERIEAERASGTAAAAE